MIVPVEVRTARWSRVAMREPKPTGAPQAVFPVRTFRHRRTPPFGTRASPSMPYREPSMATKLLKGVLKALFLHTAAGCDPETSYRAQPLSYAEATKTRSANTTGSAAFTSLPVTHGNDHRTVQSAT